MRKTLALVIVAALALSFAPTTDPVEAHGKKGTRKWCRHHHHKCKRWGRSIQQGNAEFVLRDESREVVERQTVQSGKDRAFWSVNSTNAPRKRGCATITMRSHAEAALPPQITWYKLRLQKRWCWRRGTVIPRRSIRTNRYNRWTDVWWIYDVEPARRTSHRFYRWRTEHRHSGHRTFYEGHARMQLPWVGTVVNRYPYVRVYVHSNGTFHASGHSW